MTTIWFENVPVATLQESAGAIELVYEPTWRARPTAFPVSLTMPLSRERHPHAVVLPWLANLLPEAHLIAIGQAIGVAPQDILGLLLAMGRDTAGALAIGRPRTGADRFRVIERERDLERIIDELPQKPFLVGEAGVSMSLAGAQEKLTVALADGRIAVPLDGTPSTHILKPDIRRLKGSVQNEAFCLTLARLIGLEAAAVSRASRSARIIAWAAARSEGRSGASVTPTILPQSIAEAMVYLIQPRSAATSSAASASRSLRADSRAERP